MTTLAVVGDIHAHMRHLDAVLARVAQVRPHGILLVGDLSRGGWAADPTHYLRHLEEVFARVHALDVPVLYVPGNHDHPVLHHPGNVDGGVATVVDVRVAGIGGAGPNRFGFPYEWDEDDIRGRAVPPCDVLLVHCPPAETPLDMVRGGHHVGSVAIRERALAHDGVLVCGHIHESPGIVMLGRCLCMNAGGLGEPYGCAQVGFVERTPHADTVWHENLDSSASTRLTVER